MKIIAGGDSFVYGSELADSTDSHSKNTFTALLSNEFEYQCEAYPGFGNDSIARTVISACEQSDKTDIAVIVLWSFPGRYEFRFSYNTQQKGSPWYTINSWTVEENIDIIKNMFVTQDAVVLNDQLKTQARAKQTGIAEFAKSFYSHVGGTEYWEVYSSLKEIVYLQNYLKVNNIPYLFTCADNSVIYNYTADQNDSIIASLLNQIDFANWHWFPQGETEWETQNPRGFYQWAVENKYDIGTTHPLEQAHRDAANLMQGKFNDMVKKLV